MPTGILINLCGVLLGCLLGSLLGRLLREELRRSLTTTFGFCALTIGVTLIVRIGNLAPAVLSLVLGTLAGELLLKEPTMSAEEAAQTLVEQTAEIASDY